MGFRDALSLVVAYLASEKQRAMLGMARPEAKLQARERASEWE
jgi:hypothetical protein